MAVVTIPDTNPVPYAARVPLPDSCNPDATGARIGSLELECGVTLPEVTIAVQTWGTLASDASNAVLIEHALTGDTHVVGESGPGQPTAGWWPGLIGPGKAIDTDRYFVVATNVLGGCRGSTGPGSLAQDGRPWGSRFPYVSVRDQVAAEARVADLLGIDQWQLVVGGSMGGMRAIEWAASFSDRVRSAAVIASCAAASADQIAWEQAQILAITQDPEFRGGDYYDQGTRPSAGLGLARRIAHTTYRCADELQLRFGREGQEDIAPVRGGKFQVESYLDHHAAKLVDRFDAGTYVHLSRAMATHDVGRGRGGIEAALQAFEGDLRVAAVDSDRLFPVSLSEDIVRAHGRGEVVLISSPHGHDGFLIEVEQVAQIVTDALAAAIPSGAASRVASASSSPWR